MMDFDGLARAIMRTTDIGDNNDINTVSTDWCGNDVWSCDFIEMAQAAFEYINILHPMESAPKDKKILLWSGNEFYVGHWAKNILTDHEAWIIAEWGVEGDQAIIENPEGWMPCPTKPTRQDIPVESEKATGGDICAPCGQEICCCTDDSDPVCDRCNGYGERHDAEGLAHHCEYCVCGVPV